MKLDLNKRKLFLDKNGEKLYYEGLQKRSWLGQKLDKEQSRIICKELTGKDISGVSIKGVSGMKLEDPVKIEGFKRGFYDFSEKRIVKNVGLDGKKLTNTSLYKAIGFVKNGKAKWTGIRSIQFLVPITTEVYEIKSIVEKLSEKQNCCCNKCKCKIELAKLEVHHKFIPQCFKRINKFWNVELLCSSCHIKKHSGFSLVNLLIKIYVSIRK